MRRFRRGEGERLVRTPDAKFCVLGLHAEVAKLADALA